MAKRAKKRTVAKRRGEQKEETQKRILDVARAHFERHGFEASSFRTIADEAEVAVGTVALHFVDKKSLLHAALYDDLERAIATLASEAEALQDKAA